MKNNNNNTQTLDKSQIIITSIQDPRFKAETFTINDSNDPTYDSSYGPSHAEIKIIIQYEMAFDMTVNKAQERTFK